MTENNQYSVVVESRKAGVKLNSKLQRFAKLCVKLKAALLRKWKNHACGNTSKNFLQGNVEAWC